MDILFQSSSAFFFIEHQGCQLLKASYCHLKETAADISL